MITYVTIVNKDNCFLNEFRSGKPRVYPSVTLGVRSATQRCCTQSTHEYHLARSVVFMDTEMLPCLFLVFGVCGCFCLLLFAVGCFAVFAVFFFVLVHDVSLQLVAAPLTYAQEDSVHLPQSHFLKLPNFEGIYGKITRNVNPSPPDEHIVRWLRAQAPRLAQRDEGDKSAIPAGLYAFFCGNISLSLRLLNLSRPDTAMTKSQSNSCVTSFATTKWSCAFLGSLTPFMLRKRSRH